MLARIVKMAQTLDVHARVDDHEEWKCQRGLFNEFSDEWHKSKREWINVQQRKEELQKDWNNLVDTQVPTINLLEKGIAYIVGATDDKIELERYLRSIGDLQVAKKNIQFAKESKSFLEAVLTQRKRLSDKLEDTQRETELLMQERKDLSDTNSMYGETNMTSQFSMDEIDSFESKITSCDQKLQICNSQLDDIEKDIKRCESDRQSVIHEIKVCSLSLKKSQQDIDAREKMVQKCISQLQSLSAKYSKITQAVSTAATVAGSTGYIALAAIAIPALAGPIGWAAIAGGALLATASTAAVGVGALGFRKEYHVQQGRDRLNECEQQLKECGDISNCMQDVLVKCREVLDELESIIQNIN